MIRGIIIGIVITLVAFAAGAYFGIKGGLMPANADGAFLPMERWAAKTSLRASIEREMPRTPNPVPLDDANLIAGIKLYGANCIVCHGGADGAPSKIARGLYQHAPQLGKDGVEDDPEGETYWKVAHGIRFTGMPAFGKTLQERELWQLALFLKHMDHLSPSADRVWKSLKNPAALAPQKPGAKPDDQ
jgi:mono/diheme cytochrome c family protein